VPVGVTEPPLVTLVVKVTGVPKETSGLLVIRVVAVEEAATT
jgi:hypothetical protein